MQFAGAKRKRAPADFRTDDRSDLEDLRAELELISVEWMHNNETAISAVIAGLDPAIHRLRKNWMQSGWTTGSSPVVTTLRAWSRSEPNRPECAVAMARGVI
jgi:hypothetical protein